MRPHVSQDIDAVIFDLDGVIADSRQVIENAWRTVASCHGRFLAEDDVERYVHGYAGAETVRILFPDRAAAERSKIWAEVDQIEENASYTEIPGVIEFILDLRRNGVRLGIATSSWPTKVSNILRTFGISDAFAALVTRDDVAAGKPHPATYTTMSRILKVKAGSMLVFEDSPSGVASAVAAGATCIGVGAEECLREMGAAATIPHFLSLHLDRTSQGLVHLAVEGMTCRLSALPTCPA